MRTFLLAALMLAATAARAVIPAGCQAASGALPLEKILTNATGAQLVKCVNDSFDMLSTTGSSKGLSPFLIVSTQAPTNYVLKVSSQNGTSMWEIDGNGSEIVGSGITAASGTFTNGITASSGTLLATGAAQYSLKTSSGITIGAGAINFSDNAANLYSAVGGGVSVASATLTGTGGAFDLTTSTGINMLHGQLYLGNDASLRWPNGTVSTAPASGGSGGTVYSSTSGVVPNQTGYVATQTIFGPCLTGSTLTFTTNGGYIRFTWNAGFDAFNYAEVDGVGVLVDGAYIDKETSAIGLQYAKGGYSSSPGSWIDLNYHTLNKIAAGSHSFCLTWASGSASGTKVPNNVDTGPAYPAIFSIEDAP